MDAGLLAILIQAIVVIVTIGGIWWQVRRQWLAHSATLLASLEEQFRSKEFIEARVKLALQIHTKKQRLPKNQNVVGYWPVVSFFDNLGAMVRRKAIDEELVWCRFGWRITRCYIALTYDIDLLKKTREHYDEPSMYTEFEWLAKRLLKRYPSNAASLDKPRATREYIDQESALLDSENSLR